MGLKEDNVGTLEEAAVKRKARLHELKSRKKKTEEDSKENSNAGDADEELPPPKILFRNYQPESKILSEGVLDPTKPADVDTLVEEQVADANKAAKSLQQVELSSLAPKKITFDLKRAIEPRLEKLERATDRAIAELIRERLKEEAAQDKHDLLAAVNAGAAAAAHTDDED